MVIIPSHATVLVTDRALWRRVWACSSVSVDRISRQRDAACLASRGVAPSDAETKSAMSAWVAVSGGLLTASANASAASGDTAPLFTASARSFDLLSALPSCSLRFASL